MSDNEPLPGLLNERPRLVYPSLARMLRSADRALVLQQLHFLLSITEKVANKFNFVDDRWWVYNNYDEWQKEFPWLSTSTIQRIFLWFEDAGIIDSMQSVKHKSDRRKWYSIDYDTYRMLYKVWEHWGKTDPSYQIDMMVDHVKMVRWNKSNCSDGLTETTSETTQKKDSVAQKQSDAVAASKCQECESTLTDDGRCCNCEMVQGKCEKCGDTGISIWEGSGLCVTCEDAAAADNGDEKRKCAYCRKSHWSLVQSVQFRVWLCQNCLGELQDMWRDDDPPIELGSDGRLTEESWRHIDDTTDSAWLEQHALDGCNVHDENIEDWQRVEWKPEYGEIICCGCEGIIRRMPGAKVAEFYCLNGQIEMKPLCPGCWNERDSDTPPALTAEQAEVLEWIDNVDDGSPRSLSTINQLLDKMLVHSTITSDADGDSFFSYALTSEGRAALAAWQSNQPPPMVDVMRACMSEAPDPDERIQGRDGSGWQNAQETLTPEELDAAIYGTRDKPIEATEYIGNLDNAPMIGTRDTTPKQRDGIEVQSIEADEPPPKAKATKAKKPRKAKKPKRTPEQKQTDGNMWEAVKHVWQVDDNASWKIARLQQFFLGTIKKTGRYKAFFDTQLNEQPADGCEVVAFGHWYRSEYDNIPLPENGDKLRSHFATFRGSGEHWQTFMRKANKTILAHIPKYTSPDIELEREQLQPVVEGEQEIISEEQQQEVKQTIQDLADKFGGRKR